MNPSYNDYLLNLTNDTNVDELSNDLKLNIYLTLITLSNYHYSEKKYQENMNILEDFLRKTNNLKVKIQLKRKPEEIDELIKDLKDIYNRNTSLINKYNYDNLDIIGIIESKDATEITKLIDKLTKEKISYHNNKDMYDNLRKNIIANIFNNEYYIVDNNTLCIKDPNGNDIVVSLDIFYKIFDYLLDIDNYPQTLLNNEANRLHTILTANMIKVLTEKNIPSPNELIPIILTNIINKGITNPDTLDFSHFNIENIKITDLYSLAGSSKTYQNDKAAKWRNITIPNNYLYERIMNIIKEGTYYFKDDIFYLEKVNKSVSDFRISISTDNLLAFLKAYLSLLTNETTYTK